MSSESSGNLILIDYKSYKYNEFKIAAPVRNDKFQWPDGSFSVLDIQDSF